jgi:prepilin-type N-terminal cleavage/methylation domain-containing protein
MRKQQSGFTLIEIAIVLVIIGLLLGGVLKGQELITSARVRNLISTQDGIKAAYFGFQDRYRALPGDYPGAQAFANIPNLPGATFGGNGDGRIVNAGGANEQTLAWMHLSNAGFLTGAYRMAAINEAVAALNTPTNPYNSFMEIIHDNNYAIVTGDPAVTVRLNVKMGNQIPVEIMTEVDRTVDDANAGRSASALTSAWGWRRPPATVSLPRLASGSPPPTKSTAAARTCSRRFGVPREKARRLRAFFIPGSA